MAQRQLSLKQQLWVPKDKKRSLQLLVQALMHDYCEFLFIETKDKSKLIYLPNKGKP